MKLNILFDKIMGLLADRNIDGLVDLSQLFFEFTDIVEQDSGNLVINGENDLSVGLVYTVLELAQIDQQKPDLGFLLNGLDFSLSKIISKRSTSLGTFWSVIDSGRCLFPGLKPLFLGFGGKYR